MRRVIATSALTAGLLVQAAFLTRDGTEDLATFRAWAISSFHHGVLTAYRAPPVESPTYIAPDYPPLSVVVLFAIARATSLVTPDVEASPLLQPAIKAATILAVALFLVAMRGAPHAFLLAVWLNPAFIVNGPILGYLDALCWTTGLAAIMAASRGRPALAGAIAAASLLLKPQGVFFLLTVIVSAATARERWRVAGSAAATLVGVTLPFVLASGARPFAAAMRQTVLDDTLAGNGLNLWWIVTAAVHLLREGRDALQVPLVWITESEFAVVSGLLPRPIAATAVMSVAVWAAARVLGTKSKTMLAAYCALVAHAFCALAVAVHENHLVYVVAALALAARGEVRYRTLLAALTALSALNMLAFYGFGGLDAETSPTGWFLPLTIALSSVNLWLLVRHIGGFRMLTAGGMRMPS
jgi:hypothetical protein